MLIQTYTWVDHHLQNVWTLLTKKSNLSSMQNFSSFILSHFYANYKEVSTFVSMQLETYLIQLEQLSPSAPSHGPLWRISSIFYTINFWLNYSCLAFDAEANFLRSVFVQSHLFNSNISLIFFSFLKILVIVASYLRDICRPTTMYWNAYCPVWLKLAQMRIISPFQHYHPLQWGMTLPVK